jgi:hypothetical protein
MLTLETEARQDHGAMATHSGDKAEPMKGMSGAGGMMGMGGTTDALLNSRLTAPALQYAIGIFPKMSMVKRIPQQSTFKKAGAKKLTVWYGPLELPSVEEKKKHPNSAIIAMDPQGTVFMNQAKGFPGDITMVNGSVTLKYQDGSEANAKTGVYAHHVVFIDTNKRPRVVASCPGKTGTPPVPVSVMLATGEDRGLYQYAPESETFDGGYYVGKEDGIWFTSELVNYASRNQTVYAVAEFDYIEGKSKKDVTSETLSVSQCDGGIGIRPPKGAKIFEVTGKPMTVETDGEIFGIRKCFLSTKYHG